MAAGLNIGLGDILYYNSATYGSPTWVPVTAAMDVDLSIKRSLGEVKARLANVVMNLGGFFSIDLTFGLLGDNSLTAVTALRTRALAGTLTDFAVADQSIVTTGCNYFRGEFIMDDFSIGQKLEGANTYSVSAKPIYSANAFGFTVV